MTEQTAHQKASQRPNTSKLNGKDLINIGIYAAIYVVVMTAVAMLGFIPILMPALCALVPLICGIPMMLFLTKVKKPGMVFIFSLICGLFLTITGMGVIVPFVAIVTGLLSELILRSGNYESSSKMILAYGVFSIFIIGNFIPMWIQADYFTTLVGAGFTQEYASSLQALMPLWMLPVLTLTCFVCGIFGGFLGKAVLKKHFVKAGIA